MDNTIICYGYPSSPMLSSKSLSQNSLLSPPWTRIRVLGSSGSLPPRMSAQHHVPPLNTAIEWLLNSDCAVSVVTPTLGSTLADS